MNENRLQDAQREIEAAYEVLRTYKIPHTTSYAAFQDMLDAVQRKPDADDFKWPWVASVPISEHVDQGDDRPVLSAQVEIGRAYSLSPAQRDVIRQWFNMTPAPLVEVIDLALFPESQIIRHIVLRSVEHIDPRRRRVMNKFTIDRWGRFMSAVAARQAEIQQQRELDRYISRVAKLLEDAKELQVKHHQTGPRDLANRLHTEVNAQGGMEPGEVRALFRRILISVNEHDLAKLVKNPAYFGEPAKATTEAKIKSIDLLMNEYGV
jgi:hypothetical protein